jgi:hypothetical protein
VEPVIVRPQSNYAISNLPTLEFLVLELLVLIWASNIRQESSLISKYAYRDQVEEHGPFFAIAAQDQLRIRVLARFWRIQPVNAT